MANELNRRRRLRTARLAGLGTLALALAALLPPARAWAQQTVCAVVNLTLGQQAALEREAFKADLGLTNNLGDLPLSQLRIDVLITDPNGNPANGLFFIKTTNLQNVNAVDGTGTVQPAGSASAEWLIIPSTGAGGSGTTGVKYAVTARMSFYTGGVPRVTTTFPAYITVKPQPVLFLQYALPFEVFGPQPLLPSVAIATQPFPLGLRVVNVGSGTANNFSVDSAQPQIVDNAQGLAVNFTLLGSYLGSTALTSNSLNIDYGNIPPGGSGQAAWIMATSLAGRFNNFTANFSHAAALGGQLTSLIQGVSTYTLIKDVLDDTPGRDAQFDFLINASVPRSQLEAVYETGADPLPAPEFIMESDLAAMVPVLDVPGTTSGSLSGSNAVLSFAFAVPVPTATWVHAAIPFPAGGTVKAVSVTRSDGKVLNPHNFWISQHFDKLTLAFSYKLHVLDFTGPQPGGNTYAIAFNAASLDAPPDPVTTLSVSTAAPGALALSWTATGEDGSTGTIIGGRYAIYASTNLAAIPSVAAATVAFSTTTPALAPQGYVLGGLLGNATYQTAVFIADAAGQYANGANAALGTTLAVAPSVAAAGATVSGFSLSWSTAVNGPGAQYRILLSSAPGGFVADTGFGTDLSSTSFSGLAPDADYGVTARMRTSAGLASPDVVVATVTTLAQPPAAAAEPYTAVSSAALTAQWAYGADPPDTEFLVELSTVPDQAPPAFASGWVRAPSFRFAGLAASTTYYARVKARNRALVETAYAELGAVRTGAFAIVPPAGTAGTAFALAGANFGPYAGAATRVRFGPGGPLATIASWDGARITGTAPTNLAPGDYAVLVERQSGTSVTTLTGGTFTVLPGAPSTGAVIALAPADGDMIAVDSPTIVATYASSVGITTNSVVLTLDGAAVTAAVTPSSASFTPSAVLAEGTHTVTASVADLGGSVATATSTFLVDTIPPDTNLLVDGLSASATTQAVVSTDTLSLSATDAGSGVADTVYLLDVDPNACDFSQYDATAAPGTCANPYYSAPFTVSPGTHTLSFFSDDQAGNEEGYTQVALAVRYPVYAATSPDGAVTLLSSASSETVSAVALSTTAAATAAARQLTAQTSSYELSPSGFVFAAPATLQFRFVPAVTSSSTFAIYTFNGVAWDSAPITGQVLTALSSGTVLLAGTLLHASPYAVFSTPIDSLPPRTTLAVGSPNVSNAAVVVATTTPLGLTAVDDKLTVGDGIGVGVARTYYAVDSASFTAYAGTFTLVAQGTHTVAFYSVDLAGNVEVARSSAVVVVATPPATTLAFQGGRQFPAPDGTSLYASSTTVFSFGAVAPVVGGATAGVAFTQYRDNLGAFQRYASTFTLAEGRHALDFQSQDLVGNLEVLRSTTVLIDATPPTTTASVGLPTYTAADGSVYVGTTTPVTFLATDPLVPAVSSAAAAAGSGVNHIEVAVDTTGFSIYGATLTLAEGRHTILYRAVDNVGNVEATHTLSLQADATPPSVAFQVLGSSYTNAAGNLDISTSTTLGLLSVDPVVSGVASGVRSTQYQVNGGAFTVYAGTFTLAAPDGARVIGFQATDNVGNASPLSTATVFLDATPPVTALSVGAPQYASSGTLYVSTATPFALAAQDPTVNGVASGVRQVSVAQNGGAYAAYAGTFTLTAPDGGKTLSWFGTDDVGNAEVAKSSAVVLDATPPQTSLALLSGGTTYASAAGVYVSSATRVVLSAVDPLVNGVASGLAFTRWQDNGGAFSVYASSLALAEGAHAFAYQSQDNVANLEVLRSTTILVDATPPVTTVAVGASSFTSTAGVLSVTPTTPVTLAAADPALPQISSGPAVPGSGVARILVSVDGGPFTVYAAGLTFAEGAHTLAYRAIDDVGNAEAPRVLALQSDATPPQTALAVSSPVYQGYVSAATIFSLTAVDPVASGVASGVAATRYQINGGVFLSTPLAFGLTGPDGAYSLRYQSVDNVGNTEVLRSTSVLLDRTPPLTQLLVLGGRQFQGAAGFYASADTRLVLVSSDPVVNGVASGLAFTRWQDNGGAFQLYASSLAFAEGSHALGYQSQDNVANLEVLRSTTVLIDATPPVTTVAIGAPSYTAPDGTLDVSTTTPIAFSAADAALASSTVAGSGVNRIEVSVDSAPFAPYAAALTFAEGAHVLLYRAVDGVGNVEATRLLALRADATPPVSSLVVGQPQFALSSATVLVSSLTPIGVAAVDPVSNGVASGVRQSFYAVGGGSFAVFAASFTLTPPDGPRTISFYSQDNVLNTEAVKSGAVVLDATPPAVALLSPGACSAGICRVVKGKFPVLGTATDAHFAGYRLEFAPGQNAATGYALVNSGMVAVSSGVLGTWDASALNGWQTLRLTATDLVANVSVATVNVFVGDPGELMILGNHDVFDMPQGVAADAGGNVYVADTNASRIAIFTATGAFVTAYGQPAEDRDAASSTSTVRLNKPKGVAVDAAGNIYVADTNDDRVLKLSAAGQILLALGRTQKPDHDDGRLEFQPGKGPGEFNKPSSVAVGGDGRILVADTNNDRVQVLSSTGAPLLAFALPPLPKAHDDEKADHDDDQPTLGRPFGIAVDAAGRIYVADPYGSRALVFGATGQLLLTLPIAGTTKDGRVLPGRPEGVAVSTDGYCLLVSDRKFDRVLKFDALGDQTLAFGAPGHYDARKPAGIVFHKPVGLALAADGTLLVADRNNDRVTRFGLPTGQPPLVVPPSANDDPNDLAQDVLDSDAGGTVARADQAGVTIPPGALPDDLKITVSTISADRAAQGDAMDRAANRMGLAPAYAPVEYGPEGTQFNVPVSIVQPYDPNLVAAAGMSEDSLKVHYWNPAKNDWEALASTVDKSAHTVTAKTPHFSLYQVLGSTGTGTLLPLASADPTFTFHAGYAFPNPVRGVSAVTLRLQPGLADSVSVDVYDLSGRRVHSSSDFKQSITDDGNGLGFQYTFDHVWDVSGVGSGVYMYVITAHKAGMSDIHKAGKVGVIK